MRDEDAFSPAARAQELGQSCSSSICRLRLRLLIAARSRLNPASLQYVDLFELTRLLSGLTSWEMLPHSNHAAVTYEKYPDA